jgi:hypothetical protein
MGAKGDIIKEVQHLRTPINAHQGWFFKYRSNQATKRLMASI